MIRVVSLFSGVGCFDLGFEQAGMTTVAQCEIDKHASSILRRHWPDVPRFGDVSQLNGADLPEHEVLCFGSPCQDLSIAGAGAGLDGERSGLFYEAVRVIMEARNAGRGPVVAVWENVRHACASNHGRDFGTVVNTLADAGALDIEWKCLDAQFFDVPQRRRRIFLCAWFDSGNGSESAVFPVGKGVRRDSEPGNQARQTVAGSLRAGTKDGGPKTTELDGHGSHILVAGDGSQLPVPLGATEAEQNGWLVADRIGSLTTTFGSKNYSNHQEVMAGSIVPFVKAKRASTDTDDETWTGDGPAPTLNAFDNNSEARATVLGVMPEDIAVRRLTPRECERLMALPDDWTRYDADGNEQADSHRYRQCGNGIVVTVAKYVGERIVAVGTERDLWSV